MTCLTFLVQKERKSNGKNQNDSSKWHNFLRGLANYDPSKEIKDGVDVTNIRVFSNRTAGWRVGTEGYYFLYG